MEVGKPAGEEGGDGEVAIFLELLTLLHQPLTLFRAQCDYRHKHLWHLLSSPSWRTEGGPACLPYLLSSSAMRKPYAGYQQYRRRAGRSTSTLQPKKRGFGLPRAFRTAVCNIVMVTRKNGSI